jgi:hypothetical protein
MDPRCAIAMARNGRCSRDLRGHRAGEVARLMLEAVSDRYFADGGHALDFINKGFELLDQIGWEHAAACCRALVRPLVEARGGEESDSWRNPVDLIPLCEAAFEELPALLVAERGAARIVVCACEACGCASR